MDRFAQALKAGVEAHMPGEEGLQDQILIAAIYQAAGGGGTINLPVTEGRDRTCGPAPTEE